MSNEHHAHVYNSFEEFSATFPDNEKSQRNCHKIWKAHIEKHGNVPLVRKCSICSGKEQKDAIKCGAYKPSRPTKTERDELKAMSQDFPNEFADEQVDPEPKQ
jgi:hypothetical protein